MKQKIRLNKETLHQLLCEENIRFYSHGYPEDDKRVYTTVACGYRLPVVKIVFPWGDQYGAAHIKCIVPKNIMFKSFTMEEFFKHFYAEVDNARARRVIIKYYK